MVAISWQLRCCNEEENMVQIPSYVVVDLQGWQPAGTTYFFKRKVHISTAAKQLTKTVTHGVASTDWHKEKYSVLGGTHWQLKYRV